MKCSDWRREDMYDGQKISSHDHDIWSTSSGALSEAECVSRHANLRLNEDDELLSRGVEHRALIRRASAHTLAEGNADMLRMLRHSDGQIHRDCGGCHGCQKVMSECEWNY